MDTLSVFISVTNSAQFGGRRCSCLAGPKKTQLVDKSNHFFTR